MESQDQTQARPRTALSVDVIEGPEAEAQFSALLDRSFGLPQGESFLDDFPIWSGAAAAVERVRIGVFAAERLVAATGVRMAELKTPAGKLRVALVGAVVAAPEVRGQGLASKMVELAVDWARARGAAAVLLWGSEYSLYQRLGFELAGEQQRVRLQDLAALNGRSSIPLQRGWDDSLFPLLQGRAEGLVHPDSDLFWIRSHKNVEWFWTGAPGSPDAYAALGRGIDLQGIIHEWGGRAEALVPLLAAVRDVRPEAVVLGTPTLFAAHGLKPGDAIAEHFALVRVLDPAAVFAAYAPSVKCPDALRALDDGARARFLFGPRGQGSLPCFPLWLWGLEAV